MANHHTPKRPFKGTYGMHDSKPVSSPVNPDIKLVAYENSDVVCNQHMYQAVVGSLLYLSTKTRPDIAYAVSSVARYYANSTKDHWTAVKRILRYLRGTCYYGLLYMKDTPAELIGYSDADWAGDVGDRKSTSTYIYTFWEMLLSVGKVANNPLWLCLPPKQSTLHCRVPLRKPYGFNNS